MKIHAPDTPVQRLQAERVPTERPPAATGATASATAFGEVLKQSLGQAEAAAAGDPVGKTAQSRLQAPGSENPALSRVEEFLDLLDGYRQKLGDPRVSLKGLDPLLREIQIQAGRLEPLGEALPLGDGLKDVIQRTLVEASVEVMRFRRGDYLPA